MKHVPFNLLFSDELDDDAMVAWLGLQVVEHQSWKIPTATNKKRKLRNGKSKNTQ